MVPDPQSGPAPQTGAAIEFRCAQCGKLLRTPAETAGKQAKCPECGAISPVPLPGAGAPRVPPPPPPPGPPSSPFAATSPGPGATADAENPYQAPSQYGQMPQPGMSSAFAASRVSGPAIGLIVTGAIGLPFQAMAVIFNLFHVGIGAAGGGPEMMPIMLPVGFNVVMNAIAIVIGVVVIIGALKMKNLENYGFAMAASIIAMVPCISPCCVLGLPFGIWSVVVLSDVHVKAAFRS